jgi:RNA-binding protein
MKRVGAVVRVAQGLAVARVSDDDPPRIGAVVVDENLDEVGRIVDVFGPVARPYVAVTPDDDAEPALLLGEKLYAR